MATVVLDYAFGTNTPSSIGGAFPLGVVNAPVIAGPGPTSLGNLDKALDFGPSSGGTVSIAGLRPDLKQFCIQVVFRVDGPLLGRQCVVDCDLLPIAFVVDRADSGVDGDIVVSAVIRSSTCPAAGPSTRFLLPLQSGHWYTATVVYDMDTAALFIDSQVVGVYAFPDPRVQPGGGTTLRFGNAMSSGTNQQFTGAVAAFRWYSGIPAEFEAQLDERRTYPEWFVTYKREQLHRRVDLGAVVGPLAFDAASEMHVQPHERGAILYHDGLGAAYELHGPIYTAYRAMTNAAQLGYLVSDEVPAARPEGRKSLFSKGALYWSPATGVVPVTSYIYLEYENLGESGAFGFPVKPAQVVMGGTEQEFERARLCCPRGEEKALVLSGKILDYFVATGGFKAWGMPSANEINLQRNNLTVGKAQDFTLGVVYWSARTGAHGVRGFIKSKYTDLGGPLGLFGFPISDPAPIPGVPGTTQMGMFENGSLFWYGNSVDVVAAYPFQVAIGRLSTVESEGVTMGQNDLYCKIHVRQNSQLIYNERHPGSGDWSGNVKDLNVTLPPRFVPNDPDLVVSFSVEVWDADPGGDDHLGKYVKTLNVANGWGFRDGAGIFNSGAFDKIRSITASVRPAVDTSRMSDTQKFWGFDNFKTPLISRQQYAAAFRDVDSDPESWDPSDWVKNAFYDLVVSRVARPGNCVGMSVEAIRARKGCSIFGLPLDRFGEADLDAARNEINIKHCYQVGAEAIWWFVGEFISGNTHDPTDVFKRTRAAYTVGNHPVLCIARSYDFTKGGHAVLPVAWDDRSKPWKITLSDPAMPGRTHDLTIDPDSNTFHYSGEGGDYDGSAWSGSRMHYMPFHLFDGRPRTPFWEAVLLIYEASIVVFGDAGQTESITDSSGNDLDAFGDRAKATLQRGESLHDYFVAFRGAAHTPPVTPPSRPGAGVVVRPDPVRPIAGELLLRRGSASRAFGNLAHLSLTALLADRRLRPVADALRADPAILKAIGNRSVAHVLADPAVSARLPAGTADQLRAALLSSPSKSFVHHIKGRQNGEFQYVLKHGLSEYRISSPMTIGDKHHLRMTDLGTSRHTLQIDSSVSKPFSLEIVQKLGARRDYLRTKIDNLVAGPGQPLDLNLRPGLGGLDLLSQVRGARANLTVELVRDGMTQSSAFQVPVEGGLRFDAASVLASGGPRVAGIDRLFGQSVGKRNVSPLK